MADYSVPDFNDFINNQVDSHEVLSELLSKAEALSFVLMKAKFDECPPSAIESFLWALNDILTKSLDLNEIHLQELMTNIREKNL